MQNFSRRSDNLGRSMLEMIGVLAIIGLLSVGALFAYRYAVDKYQANEIINAEQFVAFHIVDGVENPNHIVIPDDIKMPYEIEAEILENNVFGVYILDVPERICKAILTSAPKTLKLAVNDTFYEGNGDICTEPATVRFYHNLDASQQENVCPSACDSNEVCILGKCCAKTKACAGTCCPDDADGNPLKCADGKCVCEDDDKALDATNHCVCTPREGSHCLTSSAKGDACVCTSCQDGYILTEDGECEEKTCPDNASVEGSGDETSTPNCKCDESTPLWIGDSCVAANCVNKMTKALIASGQGTAESILANFANKGGTNSLEYNDTVEFRDGTYDLSECSLKVNAHIYFEKSTVRLSSLSAKMGNNKIAINLNNASLFVTGDVRGEATSANSGIRLYNNSQLTGANITGISANGVGISNESASMTATGAITGSSNGNGFGIENRAQMKAASIKASSPSKNGLLNSGTIVASGDVEGISDVEKGLVNSGSIETSGSITGISTNVWVDVNGVNSSGSLTASAIYYCPTRWVKTVSVTPECAPNCTHGSCMCQTGDENCQASETRDGVCVCIVCKDGFELNENNVCEPNTCPENASKSGTGDETNMANCKCNADTPLWLGDVCGQSSCANKMIKALAASNQGTSSTLNGNFASLTSSNLKYTGNVEFLNNDADLSGCTLDITGYLYLEKAAVKVGSVSATVNTNKIAINLNDGDLIVSGDVSAISNSTNLALRLYNGSTLSANSITAEASKSQSVLNESSSVITATSTINASGDRGILNNATINAAAIRSTCTGGYAAIENGNTASIKTSGDVYGRSAYKYGILNNGTIEAQGSVSGISDIDIAGISSNGAITAPNIYYCPSHWFKNGMASVTPQCAADCTTCK